MDAITLTVFAHFAGMVLLIGGGIAALWGGYKLFQSGIGGQPSKMILQLRSLKISAHSIGPVVMATAVAWGWLGYLESPSIETSEKGTKVASHIAATKALANAESALAVVQDDAMKYAPDQLGAVQAQLQDAKNNLAKGNDESVLKSVPTLNAAISNMETAAAGKKVEAAQALAKAKDDWDPASTAVPEMVDELTKRVAELEESKHLPAGITKDQVASAKNGLDSLKSTWADAASASEAGDYATAMAKSQLAKDKAHEIAKLLGDEKPGS